jgi:glycosyltransferase involved in cell wall biosynthesis
LAAAAVKILQQCIYFPPEVGGLESHAFYLCKELVRLGDEVTMVTSRSQARAPAREVMSGVQVIRTWFPGKHTAGWIAHTLASVPTYLRLAPAADLLHAHTFASALPGMIARRRLGKPLVITLHTSHFLRLARKPAWQPILRRIIASADWLLAASVEIRDVALGLTPHPRAEALTNGVDTSLFERVAPTLPRTSRKRLIVPRRLYHKNGVEYLLRALPLIRKQIDAEVLLVGDGPERPRLEALVRALGSSEFVQFLGARPNTEMPGLYASSDLAVIPSLMEATSVAALEAMSCEIPVAASNVGGLPEIIDASVGALFQPADPDSLAHVVVDLLGRNDLDRLGRQARARVVQHWSLERLARRHQEIYRTLVGPSFRS